MLRAGRRHARRREKELEGEQRASAARQGPLPAAKPNDARTAGTATAAPVRAAPPPEPHGDSGSPAGRTGGSIPRSHLLREPSASLPPTPPPQSGVELGEMRSQLKEIQSQLELGRSELDATRSRLDQMCRAIHPTSSQLDEVRQRVASMGPKVDTIRSQIKAKRLDLEAVHPESESLQGEEGLGEGWEPGSQTEQQIIATLNDVAAALEKVRAEVLEEYRSARGTSVERGMADAPPSHGEEGTKSIATFAARVEAIEILARASASCEAALKVALGSHDPVEETPKAGRHPLGGVD